jgi:hypothetical protein
MVVMVSGSGGTTAGATAVSTKLAAPAVCSVMLVCYRWFLLMLGLLLLLLWGCWCY